MPRTRSLAWSELKIGVLTIVAVAIAGVLIFALTGTRGFAWQRYTLKTRLANVAGLAKGSPVRVAGVEVGSVKDVEFAGEQVDVVFDMRKDDARPHHHGVPRAARLGVAPRRRRHRHLAVDARDADSRLGLRPVWEGAAAARGHHRAGQRQRRRDHRTRAATCARARAPLES